MEHRRDACATAGQLVGLVVVFFDDVGGELAVAHQQEHGGDGAEHQRHHQPDEDAGVAAALLGEENDVGQEAPDGEDEELGVPGHPLGQVGLAHLGHSSRGGSYQSRRLKAIGA